MATTPNNDSKKKLISLYDMERLANAIELMHSQDVMLLVQEIMGLDEEKVSQEELQVVEAMLGGRSLRYVTQEEYDALPENEKFDDTIAWCILTEDGESINLEAIQKYIDDAIENASFSVDYNDLINLPCYDTREYKMATLTYDGNPEGKDAVFMNQPQDNAQFSYVKITDDVSEYDIEGLKNATIVTYQKDGSGEESEFTFNVADYGMIVDFGNAYLVGEGVFVVPFEEAEIKELGISLTKGIWFSQMDVGNGSSMAYVKSLTYNKCFGELKKLDEKYLPQEYVDSKGGNIDTATSDNLNTQDKTIVGAINELELEMFEAKADIVALDEHKLEQEDLPCYDSREYKMTTLTYDGNPDGKDVVLMNQQGQDNMQYIAVKITDDASKYDIEEIINGTMVLYINNSESGGTEYLVDVADFIEEGSIVDLGNACMIAGSIFVVLEGIEYEGVSFTKGIWLAHAEAEDGSYISYVKSLTYNKCSGELKKLDGKYLPLDNISFKRISQAEYNELSTKDPNTLYLIIE